MTQENQEQEEPLFVISLSLARRIMRYIQKSPSPNIPVGEAMDIVQQLSKLPQAMIANKEEKEEQEASNKTIESKQQ